MGSGVVAYLAAAKVLETRVAPEASAARLVSWGVPVVLATFYTHKPLRKPARFLGQRPQQRTADERDW